MVPGERIPVKMLDLDTENKARGSLTHFFGGQRAQGEYPHAGRAGFASSISLPMARR
jgi:hypothetical protein